ncbi:condensin-2 complex subunit h2 [Anaeramoeba flamelloides]|uniref:Condensin-2 complex subunit h2 n=1 Tax=Anaeramoeba flamelloides TaxID=1746091 RepID=A0ABQ8X1Y1_9EUKA|nr:condensin-2 complex subunit h2 [Anaeramoeba flamelloides]
MSVQNKKKQKESRFSHLLKPIRGLVQNWNIDIASELEDYLSELEEITFSFDGGRTAINFVEAALIIQSSACVYSKKVEYLYNIIYQTLDLISERSKNQKIQQSEKQQKNQDGKNQNDFFGFDISLKIDKTIDLIDAREINAILGIHNFEMKPNRKRINSEKEKKEIKLLRKTPFYLLNAVENPTDVIKKQKSFLSQCQLTKGGAFVLDEHDVKILENVEDVIEIEISRNEKKNERLDNFDNNLMDDAINIGGGFDDDVTTNFKNDQMYKAQKEFNLNSNFSLDSGIEPESEKNEDLFGLNFDLDDGGGGNVNSMDFENEKNENNFLEKIIRNSQNSALKTLNASKILFNDGHRNVKKKYLDPWVKLKSYDSVNGILRPFRKSNTALLPRKKHFKLFATNTYYFLKNEKRIMGAKKDKKRKGTKNKKSGQIRNQKRQFIKTKRFLNQVYDFNLRPLHKKERYRISNLLQRGKNSKILNQFNQKNGSEFSKLLLKNENLDDLDKNLENSENYFNINLEEINNSDNEDESQIHNNNDNDNMGVDDNFDNSMDFGVGFDSDFESNNDNFTSMNTPSLNSNNEYLNSLNDNIFENKVYTSYEELCRDWVDSFIKKRCVHLQESELSKRVTKWQEKIDPILDKQFQRPSFNMGKYSSKIIENFTNIDSHHILKDLGEILKEKEKYNICRNFLSTLQLINDGNLILENRDGTVGGNVKIIKKITNYQRKKRKLTQKYPIYERNKPKKSSCLVLMIHDKLRHEVYQKDHKSDFESFLDTDSDGD